MQCPFCGAPMEKGALDAGRGPLQYINRKHNRVFGFFCDTMDGEIDLADNWNGSARIPAYKCGGCRKIVIDYSGEAEKDPAFAGLIKELRK